MMAATRVQADGGRHASFCSPYHSERRLPRRPWRRAGAANSSKRRSSFDRAWFNSSHFDGHELHDVVQLPGSNMPNRLRHIGGADDRGDSNRDLKRNKEHVVPDRLHFDPAHMSHGLRPTILPNWTMKRAWPRREGSRRTSPSSPNFYAN